MTLQEAVESYAYDLVALGLKIKATKQGIHEFEDKIQSAFSDVLGDLVVCIHITQPDEITITLV